MNSLSAAEQAGISYRQLDHWIRRGYIRAALPGSGHQRNLNGVEVEVLLRMAELVDIGFRNEEAAAIARALVETGATHITIGRFQLERLSEPQPAQEAS